MYDDTANNDFLCITDGESTSSFGGCGGITVLALFVFNFEGMLWLMENKQVRLGACDWTIVF